LIVMEKASVQNFYLSMQKWNELLKALSLRAFQVLKISFQ
jgi:hypothetical protein